MAWDCPCCKKRLSLVREDAFQAIYYCSNCSKWFVNSKVYRTLAPINGKMAFKIMKRMGRKERK